MNMPHTEMSSLWDGLSAARPTSDRRLWGADTSVTLSDLSRASSLGAQLNDLRGRSVLVAVKDQLTAALAVIELDGIAQRIVLCPPDLPPEYIPCVMATAAVDALVSDRSAPDVGAPIVRCFVTCSARITHAEVDRKCRHQTEWILLTSGTTGLPKLVVHTLSSLIGAIKPMASREDPVVWSTFYDIRRYGGLQILLRALLGGGSMVLSSDQEATGHFLIRAGAHGVTHISGTPSHWRRALMSRWANRIAPKYVRLSGEVADQIILDNLRAFYPGAEIAHAFASTEAGVAFAVGDGLAGFPASLIGTTRADVEMKIEDGSLRIRSARTAIRYLGNQRDAISDHDGFVDTGDVVALRGDRYYFVGRKSGIINVGGLKVHPEEVEAVINCHPNVRMSLVKARNNPLVGAVVVADVVVTSNGDANGTTTTGLLEDEILKSCRTALAPHKVPVAIRFVQSLEIGASGKLARPNA